jgi:hypothetical protein
MSALLSPIVSEFETEEQEASYDQWFRAQVEAAMLSEKPRLPNDAAMAKVQAMLDERRKARVKPACRHSAVGAKPSIDALFVPTGSCAWDA